MVIITCCKDCTDRQRGCHSTCETYKKQRAELDEYKIREAAQREAYSYRMQVLKEASAVPFHKRRYY